MWSYDDLSDAFERVQENHGRAGVDGVTIEMFAEDLVGNLTRLRRELLDRSYLPLPLLEILVDKGNGEARALCIPTVKDRVAETAAHRLIEPILEQEFEECSYGYRKGRSVRMAVRRIKELYDQGYRIVVDADIDAFFDSVDYDLLLSKVKHYIKDEELVRLIALWMQPEIWDGKRLRTPDKGIPQGSPISPILANLFLDELDETLLHNGYQLIRYADDFIILCKSRSEGESAIELTHQVLDKLLLELDEEELVDFERGFKYLGVLFVRSMIMVPFDRPKKERRILSMPGPFDLDSYMANREGAS